jgi:hydrogenase/urease accessory protein HupE
LKIVSVFAVLLGLIHGYANGVGMGAPSTGAQALVGLAATLFVLTALVSAFVVQIRQPWARIGVRVLGSWIAASGLLMLGWMMHPVR